MRKFVLLLIMTLYLTSCSAPQAPQEFQSKAGGFAVTTPAPLQESVQPVETKGGKLDLHLFTGQLDDIAYVVAYCDYAPELAKPDHAEAMLDGARDGAVENSHGRLSAESQITLAGHPGREVVIGTAGEDQPSMTIKGHLFMVQNRLYQVTVVAPRSRAGEKTVDDFLQSFKLLGQ